MIDQLFTVQRVNYAYESPGPVVYQFTHGSDLDGWSSAVVVRRFVGSRHIPVYVNYDDIDAVLEEHIAGTKAGVIPPHFVVVTDICPTKPMVSELHRNRHLFEGLQLLDHHKTTEWVTEYNWAHHDVSASGTLLTFEHILASRPKWARHPLPEEDKPVEVDGTVMWGKRESGEREGVCPFLAPSESSYAMRAFVSAVDAYDLWNLKSSHRKRGERLNALAHFLGRDRFFHAYSNWGFAADMQPDVRALISIAQEGVERRAMSVVSKQKDSMIHRNSAGDEYAIVVTGGSDLVNPISGILQSNYPNLAFSVFVNPVSGVVSLRSGNLDVDLSVLAEENGGGGHKKAAGFRLDIRKNIYRQIEELF